MSLVVGSVSWEGVVGSIGEKAVESRIVQRQRVRVGAACVVEKRRLARARRRGIEGASMFGGGIFCDPQEKKWKKIVVGGSWVFVW